MPSLRTNEKTNLNRLQQQRNTLSTSDAGRSDGSLQVLALQLVHQMTGDARSGRSQRVSQRDRTTVQIELVGVETERLNAGKSLNAERFVDFVQIDVALGQSGHLEDVLDGGNGADAHDLRRHSDGTVRNQARQRGQVVCLDGFLRGQDDGGSSVADSLKCKILVLVMI